MRKYAALFMDVKDSQSYSDEERTNLQIYMQRYLNLMNKIFRETIEHAVVINAGDSMQGLFKDVTTAVMYFRLFELFVHPVRIRAGIGVGEWNIQISKSDVGMEQVFSTQQDGRVYHLARRAIEEVYKKSLHNVRICSAGDDTFVNYLMNVSKELKEEQIYKQNQVLVILEMFYPFLKKEHKPEKKETLLELLQLKLSYPIGKRAAKKGAGNSLKNVSFAYASQSGIFLEEADEKEKQSQKENDEFQDKVLQELTFDPVLIDGIMNAPEQSVLKKYMAEQVSFVIQSTRQNAASIIKSGNANKIREMDYMALQYIEQYYKYSSI